MPRGDVYAKPHNRPGSRRYAERWSGGSHSKLALSMYPVMWEDTGFVFDDFMGDTINLDFYALAKDTDATNFAITSTIVVGGAISGTTSANTGEYISLKGPLAYFGDNNCGFEIRFQLDVVTNDLVETGFVDALVDDTLPAVNDIDTPSWTNGAVNGALVTKDYSQTLKTLAFLTDGNTANYNTTKTNLGTQDLTAATDMIARVGIAGDAAFCGLYGPNGNLLQFASHGTATANSVEGGTAVQPWFICGALTNAAKVPQIDYICTWEDRDTRPS